MMNSEDRALVDETRTLAAGALGGNWCVCECGCNAIHSKREGIPDALIADVYEDKPGNPRIAMFIAHARTAAPALCDLADRLDAELQAARARIAELEGRTP